MKLNISFAEPFALRSNAAPKPSSSPVKFASECESFRSTLMDFADTRKTQPLKHQHVRRVLPPEEFDRKIARPGLLAALLSKLTVKAADAKKLKLIETVSLGEKRFVAIVQANGRNFLVGGGSAGVQLLTHLEEKPNSNVTRPFMTEVAELAG